MRRLKDWIETYLVYTQNSEPKRSFHLFTGLSVLSAALQRRVFLPFGVDSLFVNLYVLLVAPPAGRKGTAMKYGQDLLDAVGIRVTPNSTTREGLVRFLKESNTMLQSDTSTGLISNHSSISVFSPEFVVFLGYDNKQLIMDLTDWFDCPAIWEYRPKGEELRDYIENIWVSILGAITPKLLRNTIMKTDIYGGGLTSRIIFVYEKGKARSVPLPRVTEDERKLRADLIHDLKEIKKLRGEFKYTKEFVEAYSEWYTKMDEEFNVNSDFLQEYKGRRQVHLQKLSMLFSVSRSDELLLTIGDFKRALYELRQVEQNMALVFAGVGNLPEAEVIATVLKYLNDKVGETLSFGQIYTDLIYDIKREQLLELLNHLSTSGFLKTKYIGGADELEITIIKEISK